MDMRRQGLESDGRFSSFTSVEEWEAKERAVWDAEARSNFQESQRKKRLASQQKQASGLGVRCTTGLGMVELPVQFVLFLL